jgi:hypothetical protein
VLTNTGRDYLTLHRALGTIRAAVGEPLADAVTLASGVRTASLALEAAVFDGQEANRIAQALLSVEPSIRPEGTWEHWGVEIHPPGRFGPHWRIALTWGPVAF